MTLPTFKQGELSQRRPEYQTWTALLQALGVRTYVELGSSYGSANHIHNAGIRVVAVDMLNDPSGGYHRDIHYLKRSSFDRGTLDEVIAWFGDIPDAAFIDAEHDGAAPRLDFELWWPNVRLVLGFHDIRIPNVQRIWDDLCVDIPNGAVEIIGRDYASAASWQGPGTGRDGRISGGGIGVLLKEATP